MTTGSDWDRPVAEHDGNRADKMAFDEPPYSSKRGPFSTGRSRDCYRPIYGLR